jgi:Ribbon-helix-helix protein, copG family
VKAKRRPPVITSDTHIGPDVDLEREDVRLRDGTRLTNELAQAITEDVRHAVGRPSLSGGRKHSPQVSARITPELQEELRKYSKRSGLSYSQVVRRALEQFVGSHRAAGATDKPLTPTKPKRRGTRKDPASHS